MARAPREHSATGIYHVMLRGINKQNIFFCEDDYVRMMHILNDAQFVRGLDGSIVSSNLCTIYAYCILDNHVHILVREGEHTISDIVRRIADRYAVAYNKKYERVGHLFQGRFPSEPVNDGDYFHTLLRYIHRNPVKAREALSPEDYPYSSWNEYTHSCSNIFSVLKPEAIQSVLRHYPISELKKWVNQDADDHCLDMDKVGFILSDKEAAETLLELSGYSTIEAFRLLDPTTQIHHLLATLDHHVSLRQASRLGTLSYYQLRKAYIQKQTIKPITGSDSLIDKTKQKGAFNIDDIQNQIRGMQGVGKKTKGYLHQIVEYLAEHGESRCKDIAEQIGIGHDRIRINLLKLVNINIVDVVGARRSVTYRLKNQAIKPITGSDPMIERTKQ